VGADELAGWCETISYEMLTAVGRRVPRRYVEDFAHA
jgi:alanine racemase